MDSDKREYLYSKPNIDWLAQTFEEVESDLSGYRQQMAANANIRFCKWTGQTDDGRKNGDDAFPWQGASDLRLHYVNDLCNTEASYLTEAERRASVIASPVAGADSVRAGLVSNFMKWLTRSQMTELSREIELAAQWWSEKGGCVVGTFWERRKEQWAEKVTVQDIARALLEAGKDPSIVNDPIFEEELRQLLQANYPDAGEAEIATAITSLRNTGEAQLPKIGQTVNKPCVRVFKKGEDILYPKWVTDLQHSPYVFRVEYKTPQEIQDYVNADGWDGRWAKKVVETCQNQDSQGWDAYERNRDRHGVYLDRDDDSGLVKVVWCYQKLIKDGITGIYETVFCPEYTPEEGAKFAKHGLADFRLKGNYPFEDLNRENVSRLSYNSRGIPDITADIQRTLKVFADGDIDAQSLRTVPPLEHVIGRAPAEIGPGSKWPVSRRGEAGWAEVPRYDPASKDMRMMVSDLGRNWIGLPTDPDTAAEVRVKRQSNINKWLSCWQKIYRKLFWLHQQYGDELVTFRVMGSSTVSPEEFHKNPGEDYDFYLEFDALSQEPELQQQKVKSAIELFSAADRNGRGNWDALLQKGVEIIDPTWGETLIKPEDQALEDEAKQEMDLLEKMFAGMDVDIPEQGVNTQLRRQIVQQYLQGTEEIPATDVQQRLQSDEAFQARLQKHMKQLDFIDQQRENAITGRLGTPPGNMNVA